MTRRTNEPNETAITRAVLEFLNAQPGVLAFKYQASPTALTGIPDVLAIIPPHGRLLALEVKRPGQQPSRLQIRRMQQLAKAGAVCAVVTSRDEAAAALKKITHPA